MVELEPTEADCCAAEAQAACCEPDQKDDCCVPEASVCACGAGEPTADA